MEDFENARDRALVMARAVEEYLPVQIGALPGWNEPIAPAIRFILRVPLVNGRPELTQDESIELHWWTCLCTHLNALVLGYTSMQDGKAKSRAEHALRDALRLVRGVYGVEVSGAVAAAAFAAGARAMKLAGEVQPGHELGWWSMAIQTSFGLLCTTALAVGKAHPRVPRIQEVYERIRFGAMAVYCDNSIGDELVRVCTGTDTGTMEEALHRAALMQAEAMAGVPEEAQAALAAAMPPPAPVDEAEQVAEEFGVTVDHAREMLHHDRNEAQGSIPSPKPNLETL